MSESVRVEDAYFFGPDHPAAFNTDLARAFAEMMMHGNGGVFRLTRHALQESKAVKITRTHDEATGDIVFHAEVVSQ